MYVALVRAFLNRISHGQTWFDKAKLQPELGSEWDPPEKTVLERLPTAYWLAHQPLHADITHICDLIGLDFLAWGRIYAYLSLWWEHAVRHTPSTKTDMHICGFTPKSPE